MIEIKDVDRKVYAQQLQGFLPDRIIDIHSHIWLDRLKKNVKRDRVVNWPSLVARENSIEDHLECYRLLFPGKKVTPMIFPGLVNAESADGLNQYVAESSGRHSLPALLFAIPEWSAAQVNHRFDSPRVTTGMYDPEQVC